MFEENPSVQQTGKIETTITKAHRFLKRKGQEEILREKIKMEEEEEERVRLQQQKEKPMQWDKLLQQYVAVPEIGEVESWRER